MKKVLALALVGFFACGGAYAADPTDAKISQQEKMKSCNEQAGDKKGDERKAFMKSCLSAKPAAETKKIKLAECNAKTKGMTKEEANKARAECMKS